MNWQNRLDLNPDKQELTEVDLRKEEENLQDHIKVFGDDSVYNNFYPPLEPTNENTDS